MKNNEDQYIIGLILQKLRTKKKIGLNELARNIGINQSYISKIENAKKICSDEVLTKILYQLGKDHRWLNNEIAKRKKDYIKPDKFIPDFALLENGNWLSEIDKDQPFYTKSFYMQNASEHKKESELLGNNNAFFPFDLFYFKRPLSGKEIKTFITKTLEILIKNEYFKSELINEICEKYILVMEEYAKSEWSRRLNHLKKIYKLFNQVYDFDLMVGRDDVFLNIRDFRFKFDNYLEIALLPDEYSYVTIFEDNRGKSKNSQEIIDTDYNNSMNSKFKLPDYLKENPNYYKKLLFTELHKTILKNRNIRSQEYKRNINSSQELILSGYICTKLRMSSLNDDDKRTEVLDEIKVNDLNFSRYSSIDDSNVHITHHLKKDFELINNELKILSNYYRTLI